jgi:hypothetical protein
LVEVLTFDDSAVLASGRREEGPAPHWVLGREEERVTAEALWSRPTVSIGGCMEDL